MNRSKCHWNHGPGHQIVVAAVHVVPADLGESERWTDPPSAVATNWPPKHTPSTPTPASTARRTVAISSATQASRSS